MTILLIEYRFGDFPQWKAVFDQDPIGRSRHGVVRPRGPVATCSYRAYVPSKETTSAVHAAVIAVRYSSRIRPRSWNDTPTAAYSCLDQPAPTPRTNRRR